MSELISKYDELVSSTTVLTEGIELNLHNSLHKISKNEELLNLRLKMARNNLHGEIKKRYVKLFLSFAKY